MALTDKSKEKDIDGVIYEVTPLPAGIGIKALLRLTKLMAKGAAKVSRENDSKGQIGAMMEFVAEDLSEEDLMYFSKIMGDCSRYKSGKDYVPLVSSNQEIHFSGNYGSYFKWLKFAIEVNFSSFLGGNGQTGALQEMMGELGIKR